MKSVIRDGHSMQWECCAWCDLPVVTAGCIATDNGEGVEDDPFLSDM